MLLKTKLASYMLRILLIMIVIGITACNNRSDKLANSDKIVNFMKVKATADGAMRFFIDSKTKRELNFRPCLTPQDKKKDLTEKSGDKIDLCPSEESGAKLIAKQTIEVQFFQETVNSVKCCVYFPGGGFNACHIESDNTCDYGTPQ